MVERLGSAAAFTICIGFDQIQGSNQDPRRYSACMPTKNKLLPSRAMAGLWQH
jgi:hypothetical protein